MNGGGPSQSPYSALMEFIHEVDKLESTLYDAGQEQSRMSVARQNSPILLKEVPPKKIFLGESPKSWVGGREKTRFLCGVGLP